MGESRHAYWSRADSDLMGELATGPAGLADAEAAARLRRLGPNSVEERQELTALRLLSRQVASPLVLILIFGALVSLMVRDWTDAAIIIAIVLGSVLLGFAQEYRASAAVAALRRRLALNVRVIRGGVAKIVPARNVVPGDIVELSSGNLVPADGVVLEARDFLVSEASLTGEPFPVEKQPGVLRPDTTIAARSNCVFLGTSVRSGTARCLIVETGARSVFGGLAAKLKTRAPETEFARDIRQFGYLLVRVMLVTVVFVLMANQFLGRPAIESLLFAMALAVGLSPELLPAIISVTLSHGARAMARRGVIVRRLEAIENLGGMDVLCTDKTGTLTAGVIELSDAVDCRGRSADEVARLAYLNAALETGIENPLDAAVVAAGEKRGYRVAAECKVDEIPYDFLRKRLTLVVDGPEPGFHRIVTKGAFANVLAICSRERLDDREATLDAARRAELEAYFQRKGAEGYRVLALATRRNPAKPRYDREDERDLCLEGFLLFFDPPKADIVKTLGELETLGTRVKMVTGDNRYVAAHLAGGIGLDPAAMLTGEEIARLNDESLWHRAERADLFVEVDPQQKERIVKALQHSGHTVGFLGDGINDAPALHSADVGISVDGAVDVARESADIVLLKPDLEVLRRGVVEGRRTFANTLKYLCITTSANFGNMVSMALATPFLPFLPLVAKQILLNNFLSDLPSVAIATDRVDPERIKRAQRWNIRDVRRFMIVFGLISSAFDLITFLALLAVFRADEATFQSAWFVVSLLTELGVVLILRTARPAWRSAPSTLLLWLTVATWGLALWLPFGGLAGMFGFVALPWTLLAVMVLIVLAYLAATELVKGRFLGNPSTRNKAI